MDMIGIASSPTWSNSTPCSAEIITHLIQFNINFRFASKTITNDPRMVSSVRTIELESDSLRYEMEMQTTAVERLMSHLRIELRQVE